LNGPLAMFISAALFSVMAILVKIASNAVSAPEIIFFRSIVSVILIILLIPIGKASFKVKRLDKLVFRGIVGGVSLVLYFYALALTSVSNAVLLDYTYPIFAAIFSVMYINEKMTWRKSFFLFLAFIGLLLVFRFDFSSINLGDVLALLSGIASGLAIVAIKDLRKTDSSAMITLAFVMAGLIFSVFFLKGNVTVPSSDIAVVLLLLGVLGTAGQLLMSYAFKHCSASLGGLISMSTIVMTAILSVFVFGDPLTTNMIIGGLLIFASASFFSREEAYESAK
jgi:drug/metabolite transporter (DMT)-like permease